MAYTSRGIPPAGAQRSTEFSRTYNSFSGVDMHITFGGKLIGELDGISYTVQREKSPIYSMGSADARSFSRGNLLPRKLAQNGEILRDNTVAKSLGN